MAEYIEIEEVEEIEDEYDTVEVEDLGETELGLPLERKTYYRNGKVVLIEEDVPNSVGGYETWQSFVEES